MFKEVAVAAAALCLTAGSASALTIVNDDAREYTLRVDEGAKEFTHKLPANQTIKLEGACQEGCGLNGPWFYTWMADAGDSVIIKNGEPLATSTAAIGAGGGAADKSEVPKTTK